MGLPIIPRQLSTRPNPFSQYLAPLGAKYIEKLQKNSQKIASLGFFAQGETAKLSSRDQVGC